MSMLTWLSRPDSHRATWYHRIRSIDGAINRRPCDGDGLGRTARIHRADPAASAFVLYFAPRVGWLEHSGIHQTPGDNTGIKRVVDSGANGACIRRRASGRTPATAHIGGGWLLL